MPRIDDKHVIIRGVYVVWDAVTTPDTIKQGKNTGRPKWELKFVIDPSNPDLQDYEQLARDCLQNSRWRGNLPAGAKWPILPVPQGSSIAQYFGGWFQSTVRTTFAPPKVHDEAGAIMDPMQYSQLLYGGQLVDVIVHCYDYQETGNQGIGGGLDAIKIRMSANAKRLEIAGSGIDTAAAFGGQAGAMSSYQPQQPATPQGGYNQPQGGYNPQNTQPQGGYSQPSGGQGPQYNQQPQGGYNPQQAAQRQPAQNQYNQQPAQNQYGQGVAVGVAAGAAYGAYNQDQQNQQQQNPQHNQHQHQQPQQQGGHDQAGQGHDMLPQW